MILIIIILDTNELYNWPKIIHTFIYILFKNICSDEIWILIFVNWFSGFDIITGGQPTDAKTQYCPRKYHLLCQKKKRTTAKHHPLIMIPFTVERLIAFIDVVSLMYVYIWLKTMTIAPLQLLVEKPLSMVLRHHFWHQWIFF